MGDIMIYWKGKAGTGKAGYCGTYTMGEPLPPDAENCTKAEYDAYVASQSVAANTAKAEYAALTTDAQRIAYLAQRAGLVLKAGIHTS